MIYAATRQEIEARRKAFIRKWRLKHRAVADSLEEAGDRLFTFTRLPPSQWRSARTTDAIERLPEEFKRRNKPQTVLPSADTAAMLFWALLAQARPTCARSTAGRRSPRSQSISRLTWPPETIASCDRRSRHQIPTAFRTAPIFSGENSIVFSRHDLDPRLTPMWSFGHTNFGDGWIPVPLPPVDLLRSRLDSNIDVDYHSTNKAHY
jgi:hypothetical protein